MVTRLEDSGLGRPWCEGGEPARLFEPARLDEGALKALLIWAVGRSASDVVLRTEEVPVVRVDGAYRRVGLRRLTYSELGELLNLIYMPSAMARVQGGVPVDFQYEVRIDRAKRLGFRVDAVGVSGGGVSHSGGVEVVFRALPGEPPSVSELGVEDDLVDACDRVDAGLVLVTGPTGSGKSTLLAALLRQVLETSRRHVVTFEAPIEFDLSRVPEPLGVVAQSEVPRHVGSFAEGIANALRRAPDVILVGEARDRETIEGVVTASQTGHLVYSTLHANDVAGTVARMADAFPAVDRDAVALKVIDALRVVVHQRLYPRAGGGRVAAREYLEVTAEIRSDLMSAVLEGRLQERMREWVHRAGVPLVRVVGELARRGEVDVRFAESLERAHGGGGGG